MKISKVPGRAALLGTAAIAVASGAPLAKFAVTCSGLAASSCSVASRSSRWTARATLDPAQNETGWAKLLVETPPSGIAENDDIAAFSAGFVEGFLTADLIWDTYQTFVASGTVPPKKVQDFILEQKAFMDDHVNIFKAWGTTGEDVRYWKHVGLADLQLQGLCAGYNRAASSVRHLEALDEKQFMWLNWIVELDDLKKATHAPSRPRFEEMEPAEFKEYVSKTSHCSAIFAVTPQLDDLFSGHATWWNYTWMLRIFKQYQLRYSSSAAKAVLLSGFPGIVVSTDDFYLTSQKLVVTETSNSILNNSLYDLITPRTLPYWIRNTVANQLAVGGEDWHNIFYRWNSGTYNNQWLVADYKKFTPRQPLRPWTFSISEQLPGPYSHMAEDMTMALQHGHWPSYNVPFFKDVYEISGYPAAVRRAGFEESYQLAPRAPIFRRQAGQIESLADLQRFLRFNSYGTGDPLASLPTHAIASRADLLTERPRASGAIDAKVVNAELVEALAVSAIAGPTAQGQPVFEFSGRWSTVPHFGAPEKYNFTWETMSAKSLLSQGAARLSEPSPEASEVLFA